MRYISLNHNSQPVDFKTAVMNGLAPDKGLYFPEEVISLPKKITDNINPTTMVSDISKLKRIGFKK